jgi:hypothetical protein
MPFKHPSYYDKKDKFKDPSKQVIQGIVCWALGWPPLDHEVNPHVTPTQFQRVRTLIAGTGTGAISKRVNDSHHPVLKSVNPEDK